MLRRSLASRRILSSLWKECHAVQRVPSVLKRAQPVRNFQTSFKLAGSGSVGDGSASVLTPELKSRIESMAKESDVVVFMKGVPSEPRCGFSNAVCQIFRMHDIPITGHDVLVDEDIRQGRGT